MNICYDDSLYQQLLLLKKVLLILQIGVPILIVIIVFLISLRKKNNVYKQSKRLSIIGIIIVLLSTIGLVIVDYSNKLSNYNDCLEEEELMFLDKQVTLFEPKIVEAPLKTEKEKLVEESEKFLESDENIESEEIIIHNEKELDEEEKVDNEEKESVEDENEKEISKDNYIYFLNVGASTESFIVADNGHFGLIDTSYNNKANFILKQLKE